MDLGHRPEQDDLEARRIREHAWAGLLGATARPTRVGRYEILSVAGSGGMGIVYRALDTKLHREVAVKIVRPERIAGRTGLLERLRTEAQAVAKIDDPRIVPVFDIGTSDEGLYLVMAYVDGPNLAQWLHTEPRAADAIVDVFTAAGEGLAAVHAGGIVHRDFKPSNVLLGPGQTVQLVDFGLARVVGRPAPATDADDSSTDGPLVDASARLTKSGDVLGTPGFIAPEQMAGEPVDARADQFSFCVALEEALQTASGPRPAWWADAQRSIARGLQRDPSERFASMPELLAAIRPRRKPGSRPMAIVALLGVGAGAWFGVSGLDGAAPPVSCSTRLSLPLTTHARRREVQSHFEAIAGRVGRDAYARVQSSVHRFAGDYAAATKQVCETADVDHVNARCLLERRAGLDSLLSTLAEADHRIVVSSSALAARLGAPLRCLDAALGPNRWPTDPEQQDRVASVRDQLRQSDRLMLAADYDGALSVAMKALARARAIGFDPATAQALRRAGTIQNERDQHEEAQTLLVEAHGLASASGADDVAMLAAQSIAHAKQETYEFESALKWLRHAQAAQVRAGGIPDAPRSILTRKGQVLALMERFEEATTTLEEALRLARRGDADEAALARVLMTLAGVRISTGRGAEAEALMRESIALNRKALGPRHPAVGRDASALSQHLSHRADAYDEALSLAELSLSITREVYGDNSSQMFDATDTLAILHLRTGQYQAAADIAEPGLAAVRSSGGKDGYHAARLMSVLANALSHLDRTDEAIALYHEELALARALQVDEVIASAHAGLGGAYERAGRVGDAARESALGVEVLERAYPARHTYVLQRTADVVRLRQLAGQHIEAIEDGRALLDACVGVEDNHPLVEPVTHLAIARARVALGMHEAAQANLQTGVRLLLAATTSAGASAEGCHYVAFIRTLPQPPPAQLPALEELCARR